MGVTLNEATKADASIVEVLNAYEKKNGIIRLSDCDLKTPFVGDYNCQPLGFKKRMDFMTEFVIDYRDSVLVQRFLNLDHPRVAIIYGKGHFKGFFKRLKALNEKWVEVK